MVHPSLLDRHRTELIEQAIKPEILEAAGVLSIEHAEELPDGVDDYWANRLPAKLYPWSMNGHSTWQLAPDDRSIGPKYVFPEGSRPPLNQFRDDGKGPVLIVEGTKQHLSVASYAPGQFAIYGMFGCWGWSKNDLSFASKRPVWVILDADVSTNRDVWNAAKGLRDNLEAVGAERVLFVSIPGNEKTGVDDFLAQVRDELRASTLANLMDKAEAKLPRAPAKKTAGGPTSVYFNDAGLLQPMVVAADMFKDYPMALTRENQVALYREGCFRINPMIFMGVLTELLQNEYRPMYRHTVEEVIGGQLAMSDTYLPDRTTRPLMNVQNGMVDLLTGDLYDHSPKYLSLVQFPIEYDPQATCPTFNAWASEIIGAQLDDLMESASQMLDPSMTPTRALLLFGPSRSGKSTFLRILAELAGKENVSGVTLHQLSDDRFAAAQVYGKLLNVSADLSARHVEDLSLFKMMTGEDLIRGNRKYGKDFQFINQAMFAFSTNEIPTVGESSRAYSERIRPFRFDVSFAGHEDHTIEDRMKSELPGILNLLVRAWHNRKERGQDLASDPEVRKEFEKGSDRVQMWMDEEIRIVDRYEDQPVAEGMILPAELTMTPTVATDVFNRWAQENRMAVLGRKKLVQRLLDYLGVVYVRQARTKSRALNVTRRKDTDGGSSGTATGPRTATDDKGPDQGKSKSGGRSGSSDHTPPVWGTQPDTDVARDLVEEYNGHTGLPLTPPHGRGVVRTATSATAMGVPPGQVPDSANPRTATTNPELPPLKKEERTWPNETDVPDHQANSSIRTGARPSSSDGPSSDSVTVGAKDAADWLRSRTGDHSGPGSATGSGSRPVASPTTDQDVTDRSNDQDKLREESTELSRLKEKLPASTPFQAGEASQDRSVTPYTSAVWEDQVQ